VISAHQYLRVSTKKQSYAEQAQDNIRRAREHGWPVGRTYEDVGSASKYSRARRDGYARLISDLRAGAFTPGDVLILWEASRGSRRQSEWALLLDLLEDHGVLVHVTKDRRTYDPREPRDRRSLDEDGTDSAYESSKTSARVTRDAAANAAAGRPYGRPPYGFRRLYNPQTGKLDRQEIDPDEVAVPAELFERLERGHSLNAVANDFKKRAIVTRAGLPFNPGQLSKMARNPAYAGLRLFGPTGQLVEATWPAIVPPLRFWAVQRILEDPSRRTTRPGRGKWLLSMIAKCDVCTGRLAVAFPRAVKTPRYKCHLHGHVLVDMTELDRITTEVIVNYLSRQDVFDKFAVAEQNTGGQLQQVRAELARARAEHDELARADISVALAARKEPAILARIAALEAREQELCTPSVLRGLVGGTATEVRRRWDNSPMSTRREAARLLLSPAWLGELRVLRQDQESPLSLKDRLIFWHSDDADH
jgi:site-specific DNA recombinase